MAIEDGNTSVSGMTNNAFLLDHQDVRYGRGRQAVSDLTDQHRIEVSPLRWTTLFEPIYHGA